MKFVNRVRLTLWICIIALNVILRYPATPHEIGWDTFGIHILVNSISDFGWAKWWVHPLSIGGFYPNSYASTVPFLVSGISQCTGIDTEWTAWLFNLLAGLFAIFFAYIMAGAIRDDDFFKFLVAFGFSVSPGVLNFSTWQLSTRGLLIILLPLFIYLVLKTRNSLKYVPLTFILFMALAVTHHLFYFTIPIILSYIAITILYKLKEHINIRISDNFVNIIFIISFLIMFLIPFFTRSFIVETASKYTWLVLLAQTYVRYVGILLIFVIGGFAYLSFKYDKRFEEWFLLLTLLCLAPLSYMLRYSKWFFIIFAIILAGISLMNVARVYNKRAKCVFTIIVIALLLSVSFSGFYQHFHTNIQGRPTYNERYIEEGTYAAGLWIKDNIEKRMVCNDNLVSVRVFAISEVPTLTGDGTIDLTYGFTDITDLNISKVSSLSADYYFEGPYIRTPHTPYTGYYVALLNLVEFDHTYGKRVISKFNLSYVIENEDIGDNVFIRSIHREKDNVYDNAKIQIWYLN